MRKIFKFTSFAILVILIGLVWWNFRAGRVTNIPPSNELAITPDEVGEIPQAQSITTNLEIPWEMDFLPNGSIIFTERPGRIGLVNADGSSETILTIDEVEHLGEGGLLGIALHPNFQKNNFVYVYYTYQQLSDVHNRVVRFKFVERSLVDPEVILNNIPASSNHNGGRIKFGPDGKLYVTTGDAQNSQLSQNLNSLAGKILRMNYDGSVPIDNPFPDSLVYSYGHRNPQGLAWDSLGRLWSTEHGQTQNDEVNLITAGKNYGWPEVEGDEVKEGIEKPIIFAEGETWAPSGAAILKDSLFFAGLRGQTLYEYKINDGELIKHLIKNFGRIRNVVVDTDGFLYLLTSNKDGRGVPTSTDDQIIRINPQKL